MLRIFIICLFIFFSVKLFSQKIVVLDSSQFNISLRGLSVVNNKIIWVSGSKGSVGNSFNGGTHFNWMHPKGFENRDFRDIEAFNESTAIVMAIDSPALILKTTDGGNTWKTVYEKHLHGIFLDAMSFRDSLHGVCVGDPIQEHFWLLQTNDGGETWNEIPAEQSPKAMPGDGCFASSGSNLQFLPNNKKFEYGFVSGGKNSRLILMPQNLSEGNFEIALDINKTTETSGANSLAIDGYKMAVVGGDFKDVKRSQNNATFTANGFAWRGFEKPPIGYKSSVIFFGNKNLICTGLSGTDVCKDLKNWQHISDKPFHVVQKAKHGDAIFLVGGGGRIARILPK